MNYNGRFLLIELTIVDARTYSLLFEQTYTTEDQARQGTIDWFFQEAGPAVAEQMLKEGGDVYERVLRLCGGPDRVQFTITKR